MSDVVWGGHVYGYAGYARMNRELILRVSNSLRVRLLNDIEHELPGVVQEVRNRIDTFRSVQVSPDAPLVRGYSPRGELTSRFRICFTMMETETIHPHLIETLNANYDECWTPTHWNKRTFEASGSKIPTRVMPLGINPYIFGPAPRGDLLPLELFTTSRAGTVEVPHGFLFLSLYQPTFRKGPDVLLRAFEAAFQDDTDVALVLATTIHSYDGLAKEFGGSFKKARVYGLAGAFEEAELAKIYRACNAYVSTSRGEGWNLPMCEAAACGLPVIVPRHSAHLDLASDTNAYLFDHEGFKAFPGSDVCSYWYTDQLFPVFGERTHAELVSQLREVRDNYSEAVDKAKKLTSLLHSRYTWDSAAHRVTRRLLDIQGTSLFLPETAPLDDAAGKAAGLDHHNTLDALPTTNAIPRNGACHRIDRPSPPVRQTGAKEDRSIRMLELHHRVIDIVENHPQPYDARLSAFMSEEQYRSNLRSEDMRYFLYLNALARVLQPRKVLELGTDQGCSALFLLLGLPQNSVLITIDKRATERSYLSPFFEDRRLRLVTGNDLDLKVFGGLSLHEIDLLFMDTVASYFQAQSEWLLYRNFLSSEAVVAIDDIHLNPEMERFWRELPQTKIDTGKAFHWSGFGLLGP